VSAANRQEPGSPFADACGSKEARWVRVCIARLEAVP
jgi:hypothetical protein